jgi:hypothetical protein
MDLAYSSGFSKFPDIAELPMAHDLRLAANLRQPMAAMSTARRTLPGTCAGIVTDHPHHTSCPAARYASTTCDPINPAPQSPEFSCLQSLFFKSVIQTRRICFFAKYFSICEYLRAVRLLTYIDTEVRTVVDLGLLGTRRNPQSGFLDQPRRKCWRGILKSGVS